MSIDIDVTELIIDQLPYSCQRLEQSQQDAQYIALGTQTHRGLTTKFSHRR